jgi:hypothetical protein
VQNKLLYILLIFISLTSSKLNAQASANFSASVSIVEPIGISSISNIQGSVVKASNDNIIELSQADIIESCDKLSASINPIVMKVNSSDPYLYSISLPEIEIVFSNGINDITLTNFQSKTDPSSSSSTDLVRLDATVNMLLVDAIGTYTSQESIVMTVNYN